jgi:hypothetical protein
LPRTLPWILSPSKNGQLTPFAYAKPSMIGPGASFSIPLGNDFIDVRRVYVSLRAGTPGEGLYVLINGEVQGRLRWERRQTAYVIPLDSPVRSIELVNVSPRAVQLNHLQAATLPDPQRFLGAKRVLTVPLPSNGPTFKFPYRYEVPPAQRSLKSVMAVVRREDPFDWELGWDWIAESTVQFRSEGRGADFSLLFPGTQLLTFPIYQSTLSFEWRQLAGGPMVRLIDLRMTHYLDTTPDWTLDEIGAWKKFSFAHYEGQVAQRICQRLDELLVSLGKEFDDADISPTLAGLRQEVTGAAIVSAREKDFSATTVLAMQRVWARIVENERVSAQLAATESTRTRAEEVIALKYEIQRRTNLR